jgi:hypothetical protein
MIESVFDKFRYSIREGLIIFTFTEDFLRPKKPKGASSGNVSLSSVLESFLFVSIGIVSCVFGVVSCVFGVGSNLDSGLDSTFCVGGSSGF